MSAFGEVAYRHGNIIKRPCTKASAQLGECQNCTQDDSGCQEEFYQVVQLFVMPADTLKHNNHPYSVSMPHVTKWLNMA
jgi:hypothetical protein